MRFWARAPLVAGRAVDGACRMKRDVVALVTGYTRVEFLNRISFAYLKKLREQRIIDRIVYVTWDSPRLDGLLAPIADMPEIELIRIPEPKIDGAPLAKSVIYQIRNFEAALPFIGDDDTLVLKTRPDFIFINEEFIKPKLLDFDRLCARSSVPKRLKIETPPPAFKRKIWIPWASTTEPLFYNDAVYLGLKCDIAKLADPGAERFLDNLWDSRFARMNHICRALNIFYPDYPILHRFAENGVRFGSELSYRTRFASLCGRHPFFWRLLVLHAWLLETHFHVDGGMNGDLAFCANHTNAYRKLECLQDLKFEPPLNCIETWRKNNQPGSLKKCFNYALSYLGDDDWQHALFTSRKLADVSHAEILEYLGDAIAYDRDKIGIMEDAFYDEIDRYCKKYLDDHPGEFTGEIANAPEGESSARIKTKKAVA